MASIIRNDQRGTWQIQWHDGRKWARATVLKKKPGWKPSDGFPQKPPPRVVAALAEYQRKEQASRSLRGKPAGPGSVHAFLDDYMEWYKLSRRPLSVRALGSAIRFFIAHCEETHVRDVEQVDHEVVEKFITSRARTVCHDTIHRDAALLSGAWVRSMRMRRIDSNPWLGVPIPGQSRRRNSSYSPEDVRKLLAVSRPWLRNVIILGCHTGLRVRALQDLEWSDVKGDEVVVRPELDKTRRGYRVPVSEECRQLLDRLGAGGREGKVLKNERGRPFVGNSSIYAAMLRACRRAGIPRPDAPCHAMRRTFGRWAVLGHLTGRPIPIYVVSRFMGHASVAQTEEYLDIDERTTGDWMRPVNPSTPHPATSRS